MSNLSIILGAGFSANAGLPLASAVNAMFNRNQVGNLLFMTSGEWFWKDGKDETTVHNGTMFTESNYYSYLLDHVVQNYIQSTGLFSDYEDFFQYILTSIDDATWYNNIQESVYRKFLKDFPQMNTDEGKEYLESCKNTHFSKIIEIVNYLVADLLSLKVSEEKLINHYKPFVDYIQQFDKVTIFTLNHDLLLERVFDYFDTKFTRGFHENESQIYYDDKPLAVFNNDFSDANIKLFKLHGSLDYYRFDDAENLQLTGNYNYFTTLGYRAKHYARRIDLTNGTTIQEINSDIVPKFITGKNKTELIKNDMMYSALFKHFTRELEEAENLLISGYSFRDEHINLELQKRHHLHIINHRKSTNYPFKGNVNNIDNFCDLS